MHYQRSDIINYATDDHLQHMRRSDISCRYRTCQIPLLIQQEEYGVEAVEAVATTTWDLGERGNEASSAGGALHPGAALSWNWKLELLCHGVRAQLIRESNLPAAAAEPPTGSPSPLPTYSPCVVLTAGSIFPKNKQTYIWSNSHLSSVKPKSKRSELESESLQDWESSGRKASQRGRHCLFSKLNSDAGLHQNLSGPSFAAASLLWPFHCSSLSPPTITLDYIMIEFFLEKLSLFIIRISPGTE